MAAAHEDGPAAAPVDVPGQSGDTVTVSGVAVTGTAGIPVPGFIVAAAQSLAGEYW